ncbi:hypothetical protein SJAV_18430 [Sulfurisphaera javensis]|uniref:Uncharacterized protein n=1 Tax=Sulfurisphaera javensis TaxID=2049879 RepID=A0AAT9GSU4_9CREN
MRKIILTSIIFIAIGIILIILYHYLLPTFYIKGIVVIPPHQSENFNIHYPSFIFEYKDNISSPLQIQFQNIEISNYTESNSIFYFYGNSFSGNVKVINNYTSTVLFGYVIVDETPLFIFLPILFYLGIILLIIGIIMLGLAYTLLK